MNKIKKKIMNNKLLMSILVILTIFRIFLAMKIPLALQADAGYDDYLLINYASEMLKFNWLGDFDFLTLSKGSSFSVFIAINYILGIPYSFALIATYISSLIFFVYTLRNWIKNKMFLSLLYVFLLYSPVMFHSENAIKVYRGGLIVCFAILVVSGIMGIYANVNKNKNCLLKYSILSVISLSFFWFIKEDSVWILPFVFGGIFLSIIKLGNKKNYKRILAVSLPIIGLFLSINIYKTINYIKYGEYAITDRNDTYFKTIMGDLISIEDKTLDKNIWVSQKMLKKAYKYSPTLKQIEDKMDKKYENLGGEIPGDIVFWIFKEAASESGVYSHDGKYANNFYKKVHTELESAFKSGKLKQNHEFKVSKTAKGITKKDIPNYIDWMNESKNNLINYSSNEIGIFASSGDIRRLSKFNQLTMSQIILPGIETENLKFHSYFSKIANKISDFYKLTGKCLFYLFLFEFVIYTFKIIISLFRKNSKKEETELYLIFLGIIITCFILFFGVTFFSRFLSQRKVYDYLAGMIPLLEFLEIISCYFFIKQLSLIKKIKIKE